MKNRMFIFIAFFIVLVIPFSVFAENCDSNNIIIKSIEQTNKSEKADEKSEATIDNNKINLDISMTNLDDFIEYQFNVENKSDEDLVFNEKSIVSEDNHFNYEFTYEDDSNIIKSHSDKDITLTITYARQIDETEFENGTYNMEETNKLAIMDSKLINPKTSNYISMIIIVILGIIAVFGLFLIKNKYMKVMLLLCCFIPSTVYALCSYEIELNTNIEVSTIVPVTDTIYWALQDNNSDNVNETLVISDSEVMGVLQGSFVGTTVFNDYREVPWNLQDYEGGNSKNVEEIKIEGIVVPMSTAYWFAGVGYYSNTLVADLRSLNVSNVTNMSYMFHNAGLNSTTWSIGDLSEWNTSNVTNMSSMFRFAGTNATTWSIGDLSKWDTSNVTNMSYMFHNAGSNATSFNLDLSEWNTSNVTNMSSMFYSAGYNATTFNLDLSEWNTSNVTNMSSMFSYAGLNSTTWSIGDLSEWNTSNVTDMNGMFAYAGENATTWSIGDLSNWKTSNVMYMTDMFNCAGYRATTFNLDLSEWNTSNVTNMYSMFSYAGYNATTFNLDLSKWNTSNVTNMSYMFQYAGYRATTFNLDLSEWNTSNVTIMGIVFYNTGYNATTWSVTIPSTNGGGINNTTSRLYGSTTSKYANPASGKSFTLAS